MTLVSRLSPLLVTLEICLLIGSPLSFANIIALQVLLGVGVAFKIHYTIVIVRRSGETDFTQSRLTDAILFRAC